MSRRLWWPAGTTGPNVFGSDIPEPGQLIGWVASRKAWRVIQVDERHQANWHEQTIAAWEKDGQPNPETWEGRERVILAEPARNPAPDGKDRRGLILYPWARFDTQWYPLPDPFPACVDCGLLWPCPCHDRNKAAAEAMGELDRLAAILPGCCWACGEPIIGRQRSIEFDGENLLLPGGPPVAFHTAHSRKAARGTYGNQTCRSEAEQYEERWVLAWPGRTVRLRCPGVQWRHYSYVECSEGDRCPGKDAGHHEFAHCTTQLFANGANFMPRPEIDPRERRPVTYCGGQGCRGPRVGLPTSETTEAPT